MRARPAALAPSALALRAVDPRALVAAAALAAPDALLAQRRAPNGALLADAGAVVRVGVADSGPAPRAPVARRVLGTVRRVAPDTLYLARPDTAGVTTVPRARIRTVELRLGPSARWASARDYALNGVVLGGLAGWGAAGGGRANARPGGGRTARSALTGAAVGAGAGALIGLVVPGARWRPAWLPE